MKIVYNVTVNINVDDEQEWKSWMIDHHIPDVMKTGIPESYQMKKIISGEHQNGVTYAIAYVFPSQEKLDLYQKEFSPQLQKEHHERYADRYAAFRTIMELVSVG